MSWKKSEKTSRPLAEHFGKVLAVQNFENSDTGETKDIGVFTPNPGGFCVLTITKDWKVALVTDMKFGIGQETTWIGGGRAKDGNIEAAAYSFVEKLGLTVGKLVDLGEVPYIPGDSTGYQHYWLALDCELAGSLPPNVTLTELSELIIGTQAGEYRNPFTIVALMLALRHVGLEINSRPKTKKRT